MIGGGGGEGGARWATGTAKKLDREEVVDETEFFVSAIYIGGAFSTGWSHQPVLMVVSCHRRCTMFSPTSPSEGQSHWFINPAAAATSNFYI